MAKPIDNFDAAMFDICRRAKDEAGYQAKICLQLLTGRGGLATAKTLINASRRSDGHTRLYELRGLDLSVEALLVENTRWRDLFKLEEIISGGAAQQPRN